MDSDLIITIIQVHLSSRNKRPNNKAPLLAARVKTGGLFIVMYVFVNASINVPRHMCRGQRATLRSLLSLSTTGFGD